MTKSSEPKDMSAVDSAINTLRDSIQDLHSRLDLLTNGIAPVLSSEQPQATGAAEEPQPSCDLEGWLCELINRVYNARNRVDDLINRNQL